MRNALLILPCLLLAGAAAHAEETAAMTRQEMHIKTELTGKTKISLTQQAQKTISRNRITIALRIEMQGDSAKDIQEQINRKMPKVLEVASQARSVYVETGSYRVFREPESNSHPERWHAVQTVNLSSDNFQDALQTAGNCQALGLLMTNMTFYLAPETLRAAQSELTRQALDGLRERADEIAADLGMKIDHYQNISVGNAFDSGENARGLGMVGTSLAARGTTPVAQAGESNVTLSVTAEVILAPLGH